MLLYSNNADIKYPLSDFHEEDIPNDILLDMSLNIPDGLDPVVGVLRVGIGFVFISIENAADRTPIANVLVTEPLLARVYPLTMDVNGFGWVVFGPGAVGNREFYTGDIEVSLDPEVVVRLPSTGLEVDLSVNGFTKTLENILELSSLTGLLTLTVEGSTIYIDRNDEGLSESDLTAFSSQTPEDDNINERIVYTIAGIGPDGDGNVDIDIDGCISGCDDTKSLTIPPGDIGGGEIGELPLDAFSDSRFLPGDPCDPDPDPSSSVPEDPDPFQGCTEMIKQTILDVTAGDKPIGTLYTVDRD
jgi:hypothetical protein